MDGSRTFQSVALRGNRDVGHSFQDHGLGGKKRLVVVLIVHSNWM